MARVPPARSMATMLKDYTSLYDTLEIHPEATKTEIREAWLKLSMLNHPDMNQEGGERATQKFMEIKEAYQTLINDEKRTAYNNKIGFYHSDPPPEFKREWTLEGEMERSGAAAYQVMWSEKMIRELMCSDRLRELDWAKKPPSERLRILEEEKLKVQAARAELEGSGTLSLKAGWDRYCLLVLLAAIICLITAVLERNLGEGAKGEKGVRQLIGEIPLSRLSGGDRGQFSYSRDALVDVNGEYHRSLLVDPNRPNRFWRIPGAAESMVVPSTEEQERTMERMERMQST